MHDAARLFPILFAGSDRELDVAEVTLAQPFCGPQRRPAREAPAPVLCRTGDRLGHEHRIQAG